MCLKMFSNTSHECLKNRFYRSSHFVDHCFGKFESMHFVSGNLTFFIRFNLTPSQLLAACQCFLQRNTINMKQKWVQPVGPAVHNFVLFCHVAPWRKKEKRAQLCLSRSPTPTSLPRPGMCPIDRTHAAICLPQPRRRVWVTEWTIHLWFASGDARFCARLLSQTLILQELLCFPLRKRDRDCHSHLVTLHFHFHFISEVMKSDKRSSLVLFCPLSEAFLDTIFHVLNTIIALLSWQLTTGRENVSVCTDVILAYERRVSFVALLHFLD